MKQRDYQPLAVQLAKDAAYHLGHMNSDNKVTDAKAVKAAFNKDNKDEYFEHIKKAVPLDEAFKYYQWGMTGKKPKSIPAEPDEETEE
ncbi:MAG: hypothetical protein V3U15_05925 [Nitrospinota bacterium]